MTKLRRGEPLEALFTPLRLGPVELQNRIVSTSHQTSLVEDHVPTDDLVAYQEARARGGVALVMVEATAIHPTGLLTAHTIGGYLPQVVPAYRRLADAVHAHGTKVFGQLFHGGREMITAGYRPPVVAPSAIPSPRFHTEARALTKAEIHELLAGYRQAAVHAREGGLDGVECLAGFSYLPTQFLSRHTNLRTDEYGGGFSGRIRFLREALEAMRDGAGPDRAVGARLTAYDVSHDGLDAEEVLIAVEELCQAGLVDYLSIAIGGSATYRGSTWIVPPPPTGHDQIERAAKRVREAASVPIFATTRVTDPEVADRLIREGCADAVGMTRALIADPDLPRKAKAGHSAAIERCIGCNQGCIGHYHAGTPINCTVNPWTGRERTLARPGSAGATGVVVIVGAGPAGCSAARASAGRRVVLFERDEALGGQWRHALSAPGHVEIAAAMIENLERWCEGADLRLGREAGVEAVAAEQPELVVLASGAGPHRPPLELGAGAPAVLDAWEVLDGAATESPVVVWEWGGDWTGLAVAETVAARGAPVRLVTAAAAFGEMVHQYQRNLYLGRLHELGVELVPHLELRSAAAGAASFRHVFSDLPVTLQDVGTLIVAAGREPRNDLYEPLLEQGLRVRRAGDCLGARSAEEAVHEGTVAVLAQAPD